MSPRQPPVCRTSDVANSVRCSMRRKPAATRQRRRIPPSFEVAPRRCCPSSTSCGHARSVREASHEKPSQVLDAAIPSKSKNRLDRGLVSRVFRMPHRDASPHDDDRPKFGAVVFLDVVSVLRVLRIIRVIGSGRAGGVRRRRLSPRPRAHRRLHRRPRSLPTQRRRLASSDRRGWKRACGLVQSRKRRIACGRTRRSHRGVSSRRASRPHQ